MLKLYNKPEMFLIAEPKSGQLGRKSYTCNGAWWLANFASDWAKLELMYNGIKDYYKFYLECIF